MRTAACGLGLVASLVFCAGPAAASDTYAGKNINVIVGVGAGGGFDIYARTIARHLGRFLPGKPNLVVQNMPGAGGGKAAMYMASVAPKDGTTIAALMPGTIVNPLLVDAQKPPYDVTKLVYIGSADSGTRLCVTTKASGLATFADVVAKGAIVGALAAGSSTYDYAHLIKNLTGAKLKVVAGYTATSDVTLAMERGEIQSLCGWDWSSLRSQQPDYAAKYNLVLQTSVSPNAELDRMGIPDLRKFLKQSEDLKLVELVLAQQIFGRPYVAAPGTPAAVANILRTAFDETMKDPAFLEDAEKTKLQIAPAKGATVQEAVDRVYATPAAVVERAKSLMKE